MLVLGFRRRRDDELTCWKWCVRAYPTLKWGYKGDPNNLCIIFSADGIIIHTIVRTGSGCIPRISRFRLCVLGRAASSRGRNLDSRGFGSSRFLFLRGGIPRSEGNTPEAWTQRLFVSGLSVLRIDRTYVPSLHHEICVPTGPAFGKSYSITPIKERVPGPSNPWNKSCAWNFCDLSWVYAQSPY